jgi:alkylhydroperoxidase family enzyme
MAIDRFRAHYERMIQASLEPGGALPTKTRGAILEELGAPRELKAFARKVAIRAHAVTEADVKSLIAAGFSEDEIFETIVTSALHAGRLRLETALSRLEED